MNTPEAARQAADELERLLPAFVDYADLSKPPTLEGTLAFSGAAGSVGNQLPAVIALLRSLADDVARLTRERDRLRAALAGLEYRGELGRFCDHAAEPCPRCDAAWAALGRGAPPTGGTVVGVHGDVAELLARVAALEAGLRPWAEVAGGIPDNWPEECPLTWEDGVARDGSPRAWLKSMHIDTTSSAPPIRAYRHAAALLAPPVATPEQTREFLDMWDDEGKPQ